MRDEYEVRASDGLEVRDIDGQPQIVGYAAVFNSLSEELDGNYRERVMPGAFRDVLSQSDDIVALVEHAPPPLGRRSTGTLQIREDGHGLEVVIVPPDTQDARDTMARIRRGDYRGMSFSFLVGRKGQTWRNEGNQRVRELRSFSRLRDISIVTFPAYPDTSIAMRSLRELEHSQVEIWADTQRKRLDMIGEDS